MLGVKFSGIYEEKYKVLKNPCDQPKRKVRFMMYNYYQKFGKYKRKHQWNFYQWTSPSLYPSVNTNKNIPSVYTKELQWEKKKNRKVQWRVTFINSFTDGTNPIVKFIHRYTDGIIDSITMKFKKINHIMTWNFLPTEWSMGWLTKLFSW